MDVINEEILRNKDHESQTSQVVSPSKILFGFTYMYVSAQLHFALQAGSYGG